MQVSLNFWFHARRRSRNWLPAAKQRFSHSEQQPANDAASLAVDRLKRTAAPHGITGPELNRSSGPYSVITFESRNGLHAHIIFIGTRDITRRLKRSKQFRELVHIRPAPNAAALVNGYLAKERTPQAGYRRWHILGGRIRGSHRLPGGGDSVRLSRELERDAIETGYVEPWRHTNAKRSVEEKPYDPCPCSSRRERHPPSRGR